MIGKKSISEELVEKVHDWLGDEGRKFFEKCLREEGTVAPVLVIGGMPHPVHFREGMQIRNFMRSTDLCKNWDAHDYDNNWCEVVEKALQFKKDDKYQGVDW